jgi:hypothetical protein
MPSCGPPKATLGWCSRGTAWSLSPRLLGGPAGYQVIEADGEEEDRKAQGKCLTLEVGARPEHDPSRSESSRQNGGSQKGTEGSQDTVATDAHPPVRPLQGWASLRPGRTRNPSQAAKRAGSRTRTTSWASCAKRLQWGFPRGVQGNRNRWDENGAKNSIPREYVESASRQECESRATPRVTAIRARSRAHGCRRKRRAVATRAARTATRSECVMARWAKTEVSGMCSTHPMASRSGSAAQAAAARETRASGLRGWSHVPRA